jgi:L-ribulose-5-phosphate 3-epimerase
MKNEIGVMQGRLVPKYQGRYQAFPIGMWEEEFTVAKQCGLDLIEFILDFNDSEENPLMSKAGISQIRKVVQKTGVSVKTICADYFMDAPLHSSDINVAQESFKALERLLLTAKALDIKNIVVPCVDKSSLKSKKAVARFVKQIAKIIPNIERDNINLSLETDLEPKIFLELINKLNSKNITVNYDIGNSAALGYDPVEELNIYGDRISDIHIKDRKLGGGPVILGTGDADFHAFFGALDKINYKGPFILQAYRDEEGINIFKSQLEWFKNKLSGYSISE